jgi:hypothetical protein
MNVRRTLLKAVRVLAHPATTCDGVALGSEHLSECVQATGCLDDLEVTGQALAFCNLFRRGSP